MNRHRANHPRNTAGGIAALVERECREGARLLKSHASLAAAWRRWLERRRAIDRPTITVRTVEPGEQ
jgi:hypothetical protein